MDDAGDLRADFRHDPQLFLEFPPHRIARLFAVFDLASRKFPFERHRLVPRPLAGEEEVIFQDQRGDDSFHDVQKWVAHSLRLYRKGVADWLLILN